MRPGYRFCWYAARGLFGVYFRLRVYGAGLVPREGPFILAANHASFLDPPIVGAACPREIGYLARESLFRFWPASWLLRWLGSIPVDRSGGGAEGLKGILDRLHAGGGVIVFPEGTRSADGRLQAGRPGVGLAVIKSSAPVVPVRLFGTYEAWPRGAGFPKPRRVVVRFGQPMTFTQLRAEAATCTKARLKEIYQQVADEIMAALAQLEPRPDPKPAENRPGQGAVSNAQV